MEDDGLHQTQKLHIYNTGAFKVQIKLSDGHDDGKSRHAIVTKLNNLNTRRSVQFDLSENSMPL